MLPVFGFSTVSAIVVMKMDGTLVLQIKTGLKILEYIVNKNDLLLSRNNEQSFNMFHFLDTKKQSRQKDGNMSRKQVKNKELSNIFMNDN